MWIIKNSLFVQTYIKNKLKFTNAKSKLYRFILTWYTFCLSFKEFLLRCYLINNSFICHKRISLIDSRILLLISCSNLQLKKQVKKYHSNLKFMFSFTAVIDFKSRYKIWLVYLIWIWIIIFKFLTVLVYLITK